MINPAMIVFDFLAQLSLSGLEIRHFSVGSFDFFDEGSEIKVKEVNSSAYF